MPSPPCAATVKKNTPMKQFCPRFIRVVLIATLLVASFFSFNVLPVAADGGTEGEGCDFFGNSCAPGYECIPLDEQFAPDQGVCHAIPAQLQVTPSQSAAGGSSPADAAVNTVNWGVEAARFLTSWAVSLAQAFTGSMLNTLLNPANSPFTSPDIGAAVQEAWGFIKNIAYIILIFASLVIGFLFIVNRESEATNLLFKLIVVALLINFTFLFAKEVYEFANVFAINFHDHINRNVELVRPDGTTIQTSGIGDVVHGTLAQFQVASVPNQLAPEPRYSFLDALLEAVKASNPAFGAVITGIQILSGATGVSQFDTANRSLVGGTAGFFLQLIVSMLILIVLISLAIIFLMRYIAVAFLAILSPLALAGLTIPGGQGWFNRWWSTYLDWVIKGPLVLLFLFLAFVLTRPLLQIQLSGGNPFGDIGLMLAKFTLAVFAFLAAIWASFQASGSVTGAVTSGVSGATTWAVGGVARGGGRLFSEYGARPLAERAGRALGKSNIRALRRAGGALTDMARAPLEEKRKSARSVVDRVKGLKPEQIARGIQTELGGAFRRDRETEFLAYAQLARSDPTKFRKAFALMEQGDRQAFLAFQERYRDTDESQSVDKAFLGFTVDPAKSIEEQAKTLAVNIGRLQDASLRDFNLRDFAQILRARGIERVAYTQPGETAPESIAVEKFISRVIQEMPDSRIALLVRHDIQNLADVITAHDGNLSNEMVKGTLLGEREVRERSDVFVRRLRENREDVAARLIEGRRAEQVQRAQEEQVQQAAQRQREEERQRREREAASTPGGVGAEFT